MKLSYNEKQETCYRKLPAILIINLSCLQHLKKADSNHDHSVKIRLRSQNLNIKTSDHIFLKPQ